MNKKEILSKFCVVKTNKGIIKYNDYMKTRAEKKELATLIANNTDARICGLINIIKTIDINSDNIQNKNKKIILQLIKSLEVCERAIIELTN